jgi:hypothetical protein
MQEIISLLWEEMTEHKQSRTRFLEMSLLVMPEFIRKLWSDSNEIEVWCQTEYQKFQALKDTTR